MPFSQAMTSSSSLDFARSMVGEVAGALINDLRRCRLSGVPFVDLNEELGHLKNLVKRCQGALSTVQESLVSELYLNLFLFLQNLTTKQARYFKPTVSYASAVLKVCGKVLNQSELSPTFSAGHLWVPSVQLSGKHASCFIDPDTSLLNVSTKGWHTSNVLWISKRDMIALPTNDGIQEFYVVVIRFSSAPNAALFGRNERLSTLVERLSQTTLCCQKFIAEADIDGRQLTVLGRTMSRILAAKKLMTCVIKYSIDESCLASILDQLNRKCRVCKGVTRIPSNALLLPNSFVENRTPSELTSMLQLIVNLYLLRDNCICDREMDDLSAGKSWSRRSGSATNQSGHSCSSANPFTIKKSIRISSLGKLVKKGGRIVRVLELVTNSSVCILNTLRVNFCDVCITSPTPKEGAAACALAQLAIVDEKAFYHLCNAFASKVPKKVPRWPQSVYSNMTRPLSAATTTHCIEASESNSKKESKVVNLNGDELSNEKVLSKESDKNGMNSNGDNCSGRCTNSLGTSTAHGISTIQSTSL
ncbi:Far upstream element-binding protein 1 [Trichuris trichiura]|uniref:Far upstream element-binding protein 1 n=1 Tax=Trichuris trichiura TaxID=36087 RepID=A0A077ZBD0_TRITR|nr:Far upstream element-binding protein 1 [Trichuris trichiura]